MSKLQRRKRRIWGKLNLDQWAKFKEIKSDVKRQRARMMDYLEMIIK